MGKPPAPYFAQENMFLVTSFRVQFRRCPLRRTGVSREGVKESRGTRIKGQRRLWELSNLPSTLSQTTPQSAAEPWAIAALA